MSQPAHLPLPGCPDLQGDDAPVVLRGATLASRSSVPLGQILLEDGAVTPSDLMKANLIRERQDANLGQILLAQAMVTPAAMARALARQWRTTAIDPHQTSPDPRLIDLCGAGFCLTHGILPWRRIGGVTWIATARPERFEALLPHLPPRFGHVRMLVCSEDQVQDGILGSCRLRLIREAETRVPAAESCRTQNHASTSLLACAAFILLVLGTVLAPAWIVALLTLWASATLIMQSGLKLLTFVAARRALAEQADMAPLQDHRQPAQIQESLPLISMMVPLFKEEHVDHLVARLSRLDYPRRLTDLLLVIEDDDEVTAAALRRTRLPHWIRVVTVPDGPIRTKPRALNYALNFCQGEIVGIWDAEDRPDPDQLYKVARGFRSAPADVACLQGALDYYNPRSNWLARCFTIEYAAWFRVLLPGVARLGLVVPLGGTTLFFRRPLLEQVGAWDAWNVTEDADLGVRLARRGYRTEIIETTTDEEAKCRALPWIKQRSR